MRNPATNMQDWMRSVEKRLVRLENRRSTPTELGYGQGLIARTSVETSANIPAAVSTILSLDPPTDALNVTATNTTITFGTTGWWIVSVDFLSTVAPVGRFFFGVFYRGNTYQRVSLGLQENRATLTVLENYSAGDSIDFRAQHWMDSSTDVSGTWKAKCIN